MDYSRLEPLVKDYYSVQGELFHLDRAEGVLRTNLASVDSRLANYHERFTEVCDRIYTTEKKIKKIGKHGIAPQIAHQFMSLLKQESSIPNDRQMLAQLKQEKIRLDRRFDHVGQQFSQLRADLSRLEEDRARLQFIGTDLERRIGEVLRIPVRGQGSTALQRSILHKIFPATHFYAKDRLEGLVPPEGEIDIFTYAQLLVRNDRVLVWRDNSIDSRNFNTEARLNRAERIGIYTEDHVRLDGCIVYANPSERDISQKKMMVMVQGNMGSWQSGYAHAQLMAQKYDCNVLIYNSRGIGESSGKIQRLHEAVIDCRAAISFALTNACQGDPKRLAVYGHSLGGGITAKALEEMIIDHTIQEGGIGLYINHHSFSSLSGVVKNVRRHTSFLGGVVRCLISTVGHTNLKAKTSLLRTRLADSVVVAGAENDEVIRRAAQLGHRLQESRRPIANNVLYVTPPYDHHAEIEYLVEHVPGRVLVDRMTASSNTVWNCSSSSSSSSSSSPSVATSSLIGVIDVSDSASGSSNDESLSEESLETTELGPREVSQKDIQLEEYHRAILHWAQA